MQNCIPTDFNFPITSDLPLHRPDPIHLWLLQDQHLIVCKYYEQSWVYQRLGNQQRVWEPPLSKLSFWLRRLLSSLSSSYSRPWSGDTYIARPWQSLMQKKFTTNLYSPSLIITVHNRFQSTIFESSWICWRHVGTSIPQYILIFYSFPALAPDVDPDGVHSAAPLPAGQCLRFQLPCLGSDGSKSWPRKFQLPEMDVRMSQKVTKPLNPEIPATSFNPVNLHPFILHSWIFSELPDDQSPLHDCAFLKKSDLHLLAAAHFATCKGGSWTFFSPTRPWINSNTQVLRGAELHYWRSTRFYTFCQCSMIIRRLQWQSCIFQDPTSWLCTCDALPLVWCQYLNEPRIIHLIWNASISRKQIRTRRKHGIDVVQNPYWGHLNSIQSVAFTNAKERLWAIYSAAEYSRYLNSFLQSTAWLGARCLSVAKLWSAKSPSNDRTVLIKESWPGRKTNTTNKRWQAWCTPQKRRCTVALQTGFSDAAALSDSTAFIDLRRASFIDVTLVNCGSKLDADISRPLFDHAFLTWFRLASVFLHPFSGKEMLGISRFSSEAYTVLSFAVLPIHIQIFRW